MAAGKDDQEMRIGPLWPTAEATVGHLVSRHMSTSGHALAMRSAAVGLKRMQALCRRSVHSRSAQWLR